MSIAELLDNINETFKEVFAILDTYSKDDKVINEVKRLFMELYVTMTNADDREYFKKRDKIGGEIKK